MQVYKFISLLAVAAVASLGSAQLVNAGFEDPALDEGVFTTNGINGWSSLGTVGVWNPPGFSLFPPEGKQIGFVNTGGTVAQVSNINLIEGDNTVSFWIGKRSDGITGDALIDVWAGGVANGGQVVGGTAIGFKQINAADIGFGFQQYTITKTLLNGDPLIGQAIGIRFAIIGGSQVDFDHVEINTVPEPASLLAMGAGLAVVMRRKRTRKA